MVAWCRTALSSDASSSPWKAKRLWLVFPPAQLPLTQHYFVCLYSGRCEDSEVTHVGCLAQVTSCSCSSDNRVLEVGGHRCLVLLGLLRPAAAQGDGHPFRMLPMGRGQAL